MALRITASMTGEIQNAVEWRVRQPMGASMTEDYAIVTRVFDPATEKA